MDVLLSLLALLVLGYIVLYIGGRKYLETFQSDEHDSDKHQMKPSEGVPEKPYSTAPINNMDEYEVSAVFQNQGSKEASKKQISDAMTRYPMDWSTQGPDSQYFQENQSNYAHESFISGTNGVNATNEVTTAPVPFQEDPTHGAMPLTESPQEAEEKKILQTYKPKSSKHLLHYSVQDVKTLLHKIYDKKGLIPVVKKSKQGENVWEITEVKEKNPTIVWEDDLTTSATGSSAEQKMKMRGEEVIEVPTTASDLRAGLDPFFQPKSSTRQGKHDNYREFTPGLERMFAPTYPVKSWF